MTRPLTDLPPSAHAEGGPVTQAVTIIMGAVVGLTFLFGFGNVLSLALRLGVPTWVAPLVAPAVDLSILGLLLATRHLALAGATSAQLRPARRLLIFASLVTLALNMADPLVDGAYGKAAFDAVGPLLLIGWSEVGPDLLRAVAAAPSRPLATSDIGEQSETAVLCSSTGSRHSEAQHRQLGRTQIGLPNQLPGPDQVDDGLLERAREADARHWKEYRRPISADTLRRHLGVGSARSRLLVGMLRTDRQDLDGDKVRPVEPGCDVEFRIGHDSTPPGAGSVGS